MKNKSHMLVLTALVAVLVLQVAGILRAQTGPAPQTVVYIGTQGDTIAAARLNPDTGELTYVGPVATVVRPTWLVVDPNRPILYSVSELGNYDQQMGSAFSFAIDPQTGSLKQISKTESGGHGATYLSYDPRDSVLFVAHFGGGQIAVMPVNPDASISPPTSVISDVGRGPNPKQLNPHGHGATLDPSGHFILTPDMGADRVFVYKFDAKTRTLSRGNPPFVFTGAGTGPRHLVISPNGRFVYVLLELSAEVRVFRWKAHSGHLEPVQALPVDPPDFRGTPSVAEINISHDGRFAYVSNRTTSSIELFSVARKSGKLAHVEDVPTGGSTPRSFAIDPSGRWMVVCNQASNTLTVFAIDETAGKLTQHGPPVQVSKTPVGLAFFPLRQP